MLLLHMYEYEKKKSELSAYALIFMMQLKCIPRIIIHILLCAIRDYQGVTFEDTNDTHTQTQKCMH